MNILAYLVIAIAKVIGLVVNLYTFIIIVSVFLSWVRPDPTNPIVRILRQLTEPVFHQVRKRLPQFFFRLGIDVSPIIVLILLVFLETILVNTLYDLGRSLL